MITTSPFLRKYYFTCFTETKQARRPNQGLLLAGFGHLQNELSPSLYFLFISHSDRLVLGLQYEPVNFSFIPKLIFFHYHLCTIAGVRPLSLLFISRVFTISYSFHSSHETWVYFIRFSASALAFTMLKAEGLTQVSGRVPFCFLHYTSVHSALTPLDSGWVMWQDPSVQKCSRLYWSAVW